MTAGSALRIVSVFPELLGTYGDGGNIMVLGQRQGSEPVLALIGTQACAAAGVSMLA